MQWSNLVHSPNWHKCCQLNILGHSLHKQSQFAHFTMIEVCIQKASLSWECNDDVTTAKMMSKLSVYDYEHYILWSHVHVSKNCFNHETLNWTRISFRLEKAKLLTLKLKIKVVLTEWIFLFYLVFFSINFINWYSSLAINFFSWWLTHCTLSLLEWTRSTKFADRLTHVMSCHVMSLVLVCSLPLLGFHRPVACPQNDCKITSLEKSCCNVRAWMPH